MYPVHTMGDVAPATAQASAMVPTVGLSGQGVADSIFAGCTNRTQAAAYVAAVSVTSKVQGAAMGFVAGVVVGAGLLWYLQSKGHV